MNARAIATAVVAAVALCAAEARADPPPSPPTPIDALGEDAASAFTGTSLLFFGGGVAATGVMAFGGADHAIRVGVIKAISAPAYADSALYGGYIIPAIVAPAVYVVGLATRDRTIVGAGSAALQALALTLLTTGALKIGVGRVYPLNGGSRDAPDRLSHPEYAHSFRPFGGLLAWPSGHTSSTLAIAAALTAYYPEAPIVPILGYPLALAIGFGMMIGDRHWASDVVAGALIGHAIGYSIGRSFRLRVREHEDTKDAGLRLVPVTTPYGLGLGIGGPW